MYVYCIYISMRDYLFKVIMVDYIKIARYNMSRWVTVERRMGTITFYVVLQPFLMVKVL
jgi:hypothetical protein